MTTALLFSSSLPPYNRPPPSTKPIYSSPRSPAITTNNNNNPNPSLPSEKPPWISTGTVKMPTAPWMRSPLLLPFDEVLHLSNPTNKKKPPTNGEDLDESLTGKVRGARGRYAMRQIITKLREAEEKDGIDDDDDECSESDQRRTTPAPWESAEVKKVFRRERKRRTAATTEVALPEPLLVKLRGEARGMKKWVKAKKAGVTEEVVEEIRRSWRRSQLVKLKVVEPLCRNMDRALEIVEAKTGGLVVWSNKDTLAVYRGSGHHLTSRVFHGLPELTPDLNNATSPEHHDANTEEYIAQTNSEAEHSQPIKMDLEVPNCTESMNETLYEREANRLLDGLGPRFTDWWWRKPLPVDADMLPEVVPCFKTPFRLCPPRVRQNLADVELTYLRKLALPLPTHFALGKNRKLQGLAAAIIKLWEKCLIAKIAIKVGIVNTNYRQMSLELKRLTGGVLILSNKFFIILYRGKDFLPGRVADSVHERENFLRVQQFKEEEARSNVIKAYHINGSEASPSTSGTFAEFLSLQQKYIPKICGISEEKIKIEAEKEKLEKELKEQEHRLLTLRLKIDKSDEVLTKLNSSWSPSEQAMDQELFTEEERQTLRKIGLKMDETLLLGRRGIYDGVIGSIHQHWKHREVVKVITMQKSFLQVTYTARLLEIESGGILVAVEKLSKGHAIIIYRGKNYGRPKKLLPDNLLTKRQALQRSIEIQRRGSMKFFAHERQQSIWELKQRLRVVEQREKELIPGESKSPCLEF